MEKWRLDGKDYTSVGDYVNALEKNYFDVNNGYHFYKEKYERLLAVICEVVSDAQEYFKEETKK